MTTAIAIPDVARLLFHAARINLSVTAEDGTPVADLSAHVIAMDNPDGQPILVAITDAGREVRIPVDIAGPVLADGGAR